MDRNKWMRSLHLLAAGVAAFYILRHWALLILHEGTRGDLDIVILAAKRFMAHEPVYLITDDSEHTKPPLLMGLVFPLAWLPHFWVRLIWDLVVFVMPFAIVALRCRDKLDWRSLAITWALLSPLWFTEAGYGQYNLFNYWVILLAAVWIKRENRAMHVAAGAAAALTVVIKPTQIYLLPWLLLATGGSGRKFWRAVLGGLALGIGLAASYCRLRSPAELISDHLEWARFLGVSAAKHLLRTDNYGLPTQLSRLGLGAWVSSPLFLVVTLSLTGWVVWRLRRRPDSALDWSSLLMLGFSPMCWKANFGILIPMVHALATRRAWLGLGLMLVLTRTSPYWLGFELNQRFGSIAGPLWLALGALVCLDAARRRGVASV